MRQRNESQLMLTMSSINKFVISYANSIINCFTVRHVVMNSCKTLVGVSYTQQFLFLYMHNSILIGYYTVLCTIWKDIV